MKITLAATGDSILTRKISANRDAGFLALKEILASANLRFTNIEFTVPKEPWEASPKNTGLSYTMPVGVEPYALDELNAFGFNIYGAANNHSIDYCPKGLADTIDALSARGMVCAGIGKDLDEAQAPKYLDIDCGRVAIVDAASTYTPGALAGRARAGRPGRPGINPMRFETRYMLDQTHFTMLTQIDEALGTAKLLRENLEMGLAIQGNAYRFIDKFFVCKDENRITTTPSAKDVKRMETALKEARRQADLVIMSMHSHEGDKGDGHGVEPAEFVVSVAHSAIDAGADVFIGHGPHMVRPMELYAGKPIFYSLGNFFFMVDNLIKLPSETFEQHGLDETATASDVHDLWNIAPDGGDNMFMREEKFWTSILPVCAFEDGRLIGLQVYPLVLGRRLGPGQKGLPQLAKGAQASSILHDFANMSKSYGVSFHIKKNEDSFVAHAML